MGPFAPQYPNRRDAFQGLHGKDIWSYRAERPEERTVFDRAMIDLSRGGAEAIIDAYDFSAFHHVVDVGADAG
jgi:hypothetical protein